VVKKIKTAPEPRTPGQNLYLKGHKMDNKPLPTLYATARSLAKRGFSVFPCQPRGKEPATAHGCLDATADIERVDGWWGAMPELNIGIATGAPSGFWALDIDGDEGEASLRKLEAEHGALAATIEVITGKGRHCWFRIGEHGAIKNSASEIAPGLDVRGDGGYVVAPPSIHPSGRTYAWSVDCASELADAPDWLHAMVAANKSGQKGKPVEHWHKVLTSPIHNGERNATLTSVCGKLLHFGVDDLTLLYDVMLCINIARYEGPLPENEIEAIVRSVVQTHFRWCRLI
jgi:hypothetical protein